MSKFETPWRERLVQDDPRRECRKWNAPSEEAWAGVARDIATIGYRHQLMRFYHPHPMTQREINRRYQRERNRYGVDAVPIVHAARQCGRTMMLHEVENLYRLEHPNATVVHVYPGVDGARVEVTVTPGEASPSSLSVEAVAYDTPQPEPLEVPPWEKP